MILFQNIDVYAPEYLGRKDVLTVYDKIVKIADAGTITADGLLSGAETVDRRRNRTCPDTWLCRLPCSRARRRR